LAQGWTDALRTRYPDERIYTFWDYFRQHWQTNSGLRIDHLLLNAELAPRMVDAGVDKWVRGEARASDHAPTWIELDLGEVPAKKVPAKKVAAKKAPAKTTKAPAAKRRAPRA
jgi:exodeoxyribonuclease-3